jgi:DNA-binding CsgD family transcriptional regulator
MRGRRRSVDVIYASAVPGRGASPSDVDGYTTALRHLLCAQAALRAGHLRQAESLLPEARRAAAEAVLGLVDALAGLGRTREAAPAVAELAAELAGVDAPAAHAILQICQAVLARDAGALDTADQLLTAARRGLHRTGLPYELARTTERQGQWRCERGQSGGGLLECALRQFDTLGATRDVARVRRTMRQHRVPVPYPWRGGRRAYGQALSPREREVALLAAEGHTNQEIAERLYLSRRTVESHVASALRKLAASSRRDLARLLVPDQPE